jgi:hypothetical protein
MCYYCPAERSDASAVGGALPPRYPALPPSYPRSEATPAPLGGATPAETAAPTSPPPAVPAETPPFSRRI